MMKTNSIIMLTDKDLTVDNAADYFLSCRDLPIQNWGFKSIGQPHDVMYALADVIKSEGKTLFIESITYSDEEYKFLAEFSVKAGVDCVLGTIYDEHLHHALEENRKRYYPFVGKTPGLPARIIKTMDEIMDDMFAAVDTAGVQGVSVPAYMHDAMSGFEILSALRRAKPDLPIIVAGRVNDKKRIDEMFELGTSFTIGGAIFNGKFVPGGSYRENMEELYGYMESC
jgi:DNA-binding NarL/FixJ family response regulator